MKVKGMYIIESGKCNIVNFDAKGNKTIITEMGRNDQFGCSGVLQIAVSSSCKSNYLFYVDPRLSRLD